LHGGVGGVAVALLATLIFSGVATLAGVLYLAAIGFAGDYIVALIKAFNSPASETSSKGKT
jgi:hypothetical protein